MKIEYEGETLEFDLEEITLQQATVMYKQLGLTLLKLDTGLIEGNPDALRAVYWLIRTQQGDKVDINEVDFKIVKLSNAIQTAVDKENAEKEATKEADGPKEE